MASIIKANQLQDFGGNSIITSDGAGTITLSSGMNTAVAAGTNNTPAFSAYNSAAQSIPNTTETKCIFNTEIVDTNNMFADSRFTCSTAEAAGKYWITFSLDLDGMDDTETVVLTLYKNGSGSNVQGGRQIKAINTISGNAGNCMVQFSGVIDVVQNDYFEVYAYQYDSVANNTRTDFGNMFAGYKIIGA